MSYKKGSTSSLWRHVKRRHGIEQKQEESSETPESNSLVQPTITQMINSRAKYDNKSERKCEINNLIRDMLFIDLQPISFTQDLGFKRLLAYIEPQYVIPSRETFSYKVSEAYKTASVALRSKIKQVVSYAGGYASFNLTTDGWTSRR